MSDLLRSHEGLRHDAGHCNIGAMSKTDVPEGALLGISELDAEHSLQFRLLRTLQDAFARSDRRQALELIDRLDDASNMHFLLEETLMIRRAYPNHQAHRQEHDHLIEKLRTLRSTVVSGSAAEPLTQADAIAQWLLGHIQTFDRALAAYLLAHPAGRGGDTQPEER
jgi:hemerythrin